MTYEPPFEMTEKVTHLCMRISEELGRMSVTGRLKVPPRLRRINRIRSIHSSLAIENNRLSQNDVRDVIDGKPVLGPEREIQEVKNAFDVYDMMDGLDPFSVDDLLKSHSVMMRYLVPHEGEFRKGGEGVFDADGNCVHMAPPFDLVPCQITELLEWARSSGYPMLIKSCVFHYEFEFIHPFEDGNGRMGRFWHTLMLSRWNEVFKWLPVESTVRRHQVEYYDAIASSNDAGDSTVFLEVMLGMILESLRTFSEESFTSVSATQSGLSGSEAAVYAIVRDGQFTNISEVSLMIGLSESTVARALTSLKDRKLIVRIGSKKTGKWVLSDGRLINSAH